MNNPFEEISGKVENLSEVVQRVLSIVESLATAKNTPQKKWLTREEVAEKLDICLSQVDKLVKKGTLKKYKLESLTRFDSTEVDTALKSYQKHQRNDSYIV